MGMTDIQFKAYQRLMIRLLEEAKSEKELERVIKRIEALIRDLQISLED
ncbi:MAG: hypothetical protein LBE35_03500 [Clostridiales bacterium]|nr:hypothetical protein [Clostridiales bacterium]